MSEDSPGPPAGQGPAGKVASQHEWDMPWIEAIGAGPPERKQLAAAFG
jgi:hypothetical protein